MSCPHDLRYHLPMKVLTLDQARDQLGVLCDDAQHGETVLLKHGTETFILQPASSIPPTCDLDWEDPDFEADMLVAVEGQHTPLADGELKQRGEAILQRLRQRRAP